MRPYFDSTGDSPEDAKVPRLLLVSFHFPPGTAVGGVRWEKIARYVHERGWFLDVVALDPSALQRRDEGRLASLPPGVRAFGVLPPGQSIVALPRTLWRGLSRLRRRSPPHAAEALGRAESTEGRLAPHIRLTRAYYAWLDFVEGRRLAKAAERAGVRLTRRTSYIAVVSSGPPHAAHEAARRIARRAGLPLILDFRDPWSLIERVPKDAASPTWFALAEKQERRVLGEAKVIAMNTQRASDAMRSKYPQFAKRIIAIQNGSDDEQFPTPEPSRRFTIRFAGTIYIDRDPRLVFRASKLVIDALQLSPSDFGLSFIGDVSQFGGRPLQEMAREEGVEDFVEVGSAMPRAAAMQFLSNGTMLLNLPQDSDLAIPAKVFEYVRFDAWLLILADRESATADLLRGTEAEVVEPHDVSRMAEVIERRYREFVAGARPAAVNRDGRFNRRIQANLLLDLIEKVSMPAPTTKSRVGADSVSGRLDDTRNDVDHVPGQT